jgi:hypothetical protein
MMFSDRRIVRRKIAQKRLSEAQDGWIEAIQNYAHDTFDAEVLRARVELEQARSAYLAIVSGREASRAETSR